MDRKSVYVNSTWRTAGTNEDFTITKLVQEFSQPPKSVKLVGASIPYTWQNITVNNNTFTITQSPGGASEDFVIPVGNYNPTELATLIQMMVSASVVLGQVYTVTYSSAMSAFTFTTVGPDSFQIIFSEPSAAMSLGFAPGSTNPSMPATSVSSTAAVQLLPDYEIFVCSDLVKGSDNGVMPWNPALVLTPDDQPQILARVPVTGCHGGVIHFKPSDDLPYYGVTQSSFARSISAGTPATIRFFLVLPSGNVLDLEGYPWTMELVFDFNSS